MANTYSQIYIHIVFAVESRAVALPSQYKEELHKFITGIIKNRGQKLIAINSMPDHVHILVGQKPDIELSNLVRDIKAGSSKFINDNRWVMGRFNWQEGFGAFSYSHSQLQDVNSYIQNQEQHHRKRTFRNEYIEMLEKFKVDYDERYIFQSDETGRS
jgi:putative transposase